MMNRKDISFNPSALRPAEVIQRYGQCLELVPIDKYFHDISIGLYAKGAVCTLWTFSKKEGARDRVKVIRDQMIALGGMERIPETDNQVSFPCGHLHAKPLKFLLAQAVGKSPDYSPPEANLEIKDSKSDLTIVVSEPGMDGGGIYQVGVEGNARNPDVRLQMILAGFVRYGDMQLSGESGIRFQCGERHGQLVRVLMPYSRNISNVENMLAAETTRGQMTTGTLGFSQV